MRRLNINELTFILDKHNVHYYIDNDHIYADNMEAHTSIFDTVVDITHYTFKQIRDFLGY